MIIDCVSDPNTLIDQIGDRYFSIEDEHKAATFSRVRITDCENEINIEICTYGLINAFEAAQALCALLNQEYIIK
jgi:hypothetical protein